MQLMLKFSTKLLTISGVFLFLSIPVLNAQLPENARKLKIIRSTSSMIDQAVEKDLIASELKPFPIIDEATFLRRTYIGIIGRIPTHKEATTFLNSKQSDKRAALIDSLVYSPGYESKTFNYWADLLRLESNDEQYGLGWHVWLRDSVAANKPYDKMVYEMLSASGHASKNPAVGYYLRDRNMLLDNISNSVQVFLGTQIGCAQCHDHPFEDWTQKQYYQLAAFGANIDYKSESQRKKILETAIHISKEKGLPEIANNSKKGKNKKNNNRSKNNQLKKIIRTTNQDLKSIFQRFSKNEITLNNTKTLKLPDDYQYNDGKPGEVVKPNPIFKEIPNLHQGPNRLENFAKWVTAPNNPQFTKSIANRLWQHVYGYGLAEPLDNWTDRTKVSHPAALALVERILLKNNYNIRETLRILYHTQLFQRTVSTAEVVPGSTYAFQGPILRRLSAEELHDSFLTLEKGNLDAKRNLALTTRWETYTSTINSILSASPETIIKIGAIGKETEKKQYSLKSEARKLRLAVNKAEGEGLPKKAKELQSQLREIYSEIKSIQKQSASKASKDIPMAASMVQMASMNTLRTKSKGSLRASEIPAPAKGGRFLSMFGASDRQTSNAAQTDASIPQTLTLLNGREVLSVTDRKGTLPNLLMKANSPTEKLNILFITIYSRYPTDTELKKYQALMKNPKQTQVLAKAMLNSKRFLFLQ
ncbi:MAG: hypothetical protein ACI9E1_001578 [Cryomorphaceae bacterium]|jgi:hypothetical protein